MPWFGYFSEFFMSGGSFVGASFCHSLAIPLSWLCQVEVLVLEVFALVLLFL